MSDQDGRQVSVIPRPSTEDAREWQVYWQTLGYPWRTQPEIGKERQEELNERRKIISDIKQCIYPFKGVKLSRADVEWLLSTHESEGIYGPVDCNDEHQRTREGLDIRGAIFGNWSYTQPTETELNAWESHWASDDEEDYLGENLSNLPLARLCGGLTFNEWIDSTDEQRAAAAVHLQGANLTKANLQEANLREAKLQEAILIEVQLQEANLKEANSQQANLFMANLQQADLLKINLQQAFLIGANLQQAFLMSANLQQAVLMDANLQHAILEETNLQRAELWGANLRETSLRRTNLQEANLRGAQLEGADPEGAMLSNEKQIGPQLADSQWDNVNLAVIVWKHVKILGDEYVARQKMDEEGKVKDKQTVLSEYEVAVRANRQLAVILRNQGLNEVADHFSYRAQVLQQRVLWLQIGRWQWMEQLKDSVRRSRVWKLLIEIWQKVQQSEVWKQSEKLGQGIHTGWMQILKLIAFAFSVFLGAIAGYGYKPGRTVLWYLLTIAGFATVYAILGHLQPFPDALVFSVMSFHGRGFFPSLANETNLHNPLVILAAAEAVIGLIIEVSFIATFTQRFFGK